MHQSNSRHRDTIQTKLKPRLVSLHDGNGSGLFLQTRTHMGVTISSWTRELKPTRYHSHCQQSTGQAWTGEYVGEASVGPNANPDGPLFSAEFVCLCVCLWPALLPFNVNRFWWNLVTRTLLWSSLAATIMVQIGRRGTAQRLFENFQKF